MFNTLEAWFRSGASGTVIMIFIALGTLFYAGAAWFKRSPGRARLAHALETCAFITLAVAGLLFAVGGPFNE